MAILTPGTPWFRRFWHGWQRIARWIGDLLSRTITTLAYVVVVPLFAIGVRLFADPLQLQPRPSRWIEIPPAPSGLDEARRGL